MPIRHALMLTAAGAFFTVTPTAADVQAPGFVNYCAANAVPLIISVTRDQTSITAGVTPPGGDVRLTVNFNTAWPRDCTAVLHIDVLNQDNSTSQPRGLIVPQGLNVPNGATSFTKQLLSSGDDGHDVTKRLVVQTGTSANNPSHPFIPVGNPVETTVQVKFNRIGDFIVPASVVGSATFNVVVRTQLPYKQNADGYSFDLDADPARLTDGDNGSSFRASTTRVDSATGGSSVTVPAKLTNDPCGNYNAQLFLDALGNGRLLTRNLTVTRAPNSIGCLFVDPKKLPKPTVPVH